MVDTRRLIVNADDFGLSSGVNASIISTHAHGIVTSASVMVRQPWAADAAARSRHYPNLSLGLHLDLGEWRYDGQRWVALYEVVPLEDAIAVTDEARRQLETFRNVVGREPTHIDSHQHVHRREPVRSIVRALACELGVPLRHFTPAIQYCGRFYGQSTEGAAMPEAITVDALIGILTTLPAGTTELGCHPGEEDDGETMYRHERARETSVLSDPRVRSALATESIELCSFAGIAGQLGGDIVHCRTAEQLR